MRLDAPLEEIAQGQQGCVAVSTAAQLGASRTEIDRMRASKLWVPMGKRVLGLRGWPNDDLHRASAAVLEAGPDAALGFASTGAMWDLGSYYRILPAQIVHVAGAAKSRSLGRIHPIVGLPQSWITTLHGIAVVRPELCIYQLCGTEPPKRAERALDRAWSNRLLSGKSLRACLTELRRSGRNGTIVLEALLDARGPDYVPPASGLEGRFIEITESVGRSFRRQVDSGGEQWTGRVDFRDKTRPLIAEVQSEKYHTALSDKDADKERRERLERDGFVVVEVWDTQVWHRPREVFAALDEGYRELNQRLS